MVTQPQLYSCNKNITLKMARLLAKTCRWEYSE